MDKNEFREKTEQMLECIKQKRYADAVEIANDIDWKKVKNVTMLCAASEVFEYSGDYEKSQDILMSAYDKSPESRKIVYRLGSLALKLDDIQEATACYEEFVELAPKDPNQYILKYKILRKQGESVAKQIEALEEFKKVEYVEKWAYELAKLYNEAGMITECLEECDDLILWFSEGRFVSKAMELKMKYKPLTPLQQEKYDQKAQEPKPAVTPEEEPIEEPAAEPVEEPVEEVVEEPVAEPVEEATEEPAEELVEEPVEEPAEEPIEIEEEEPEEVKSPTGGLSIPEILQNWEEKQRENAEMIQAEQERIQAEQEAEPKEEVEEEDSILPDDIRLLMEELESESADTYVPKVPAPQKKGVAAVAETLAEVKDAVGAAVASVVSAVVDEPEKPAEKEEVEEQESEKPDIQIGDTQEVMLSAKALVNDEVIEITEEEPEEKKESSPYDTGFIVQGRYDLDAQSEIGTKAGLTEEQKKMFSYFVPVHGMSEQIVEVLAKDKACHTRYGTSRTGNILVIGRKGSGKTVLASNIVKAIQKARGIRHGKLAIVTAESLNKKDLAHVFEKLHGGAIVIEHASRLNRRTVTRLSDLMEEDTGEMLFVLEDERKPLEKMLSANPRFAKKFTTCVKIPVFINDELATFGQTYAKENGYKIDDTSILALYTKIDILQREEAVVTVADVKEIIDEAIERSRRFNVKNVAKKLFGKAKDESDRILLTEKDFR